MPNKHPCSQNYGFPSSHVWMLELNHKESWALKNWYFQIVVLEKTFESFMDWKEVKPVNPKGNQPWIVIGRTDAEAEVPNTLATWCEEPTYWKRPWCWERLRAKGEEGDRGWDGWMASPIQWTWIWANSGRERGTGRPGISAGHGVVKSWTWLSDWATAAKNSILIQNDGIQAKQLFLCLSITVPSALILNVLLTAFHKSVWSPGTVTCMALKSNLKDFCILQTDSRNRACSRILQSQNQHIWVKEYFITIKIAWKEWQ